MNTQLLRAKRWWLARRTADPAMRDWLQARLPAAQDWFTQVGFIAVDLETTALDAKKGEIASVGWVCIDRGMVQVASAQQYLITTPGGVGQSAVFHQLRDSELDRAESIRPVMLRFLQASQGRVLVFHNAILDMAFINRAYKRLYGAPMRTWVVDTLQLEKRRLLRGAETIKPDSLRLHACRARYGLPDYPAHDALTDAHATAELLIAWAAHYGGDKSVQLRDCLA